MVLAYDPFWLHPMGSMLADQLRELRLDALDAGLMSEAALAPMGRAMKRLTREVGFNVNVTFNPNNFLLPKNKSLPAYMPAWEFASEGFATATTKGKQREASPNSWEICFNFTAADIAAVPGPINWRRYTLDGSRRPLAPPGQSAADQPLHHFLTMGAVDAGLSERVNLMPGVTRFEFAAKGFFFGKLRPGGNWFDSTAWSGPFPTTKASRDLQARYFAAQWGSMPTLPRSVAAVYSPRIAINFTQAAYTDLKLKWTSSLNNWTDNAGSRRLNVLAWSFIKGKPGLSGQLSFNDASFQLVAVPPPGKWYRVAQVQAVVAEGPFWQGTAAAPPPPFPPPSDWWEDDGSGPILPDGSGSGDCWWCP